MFGLLITLVYPIFVNPVPLPYKHWLVSRVKAVVELVKNIIEFVVLLYIPLVPQAAFYTVAGAVPALGL